MAADRKLFSICNTATALPDINSSKGICISLCPQASVLRFPFSLRIPTWVEEPLIIPQLIKKSCKGGFCTEAYPALLNKKVGASFIKSLWWRRKKGGFESRISRDIKFSSPSQCTTQLPWHKENTWINFLLFFLEFSFTSLCTEN